MAPEPAIAGMIVEPIHYNANSLGHYVCHAFAVMPNHVHLLVTPAVELPNLTKSLKGITAKRANTMLAKQANTMLAKRANTTLALTGDPFGQGRELRPLGSPIKERMTRSGICKYVIRSDLLEWRAPGRFFLCYVPQPKGERTHHTTSPNRKQPAFGISVQQILLPHFQKLLD